MDKICTKVLSSTEQSHWTSGCNEIVCIKDLLLKFLCQLVEVLSVFLSSLHNVLLSCCLGNLIHLLGQVSLGTIQLCCQLFVFL